MEKAEIVAGIKSAIERGYSLEQAKQSFINAGYNQDDVEDAARYFQGVQGTTQFYSPMSQPRMPAQQTPQRPPQQTPQQRPIPQLPSLPSSSQNSQVQQFYFPNKQENPKKSKMTVVIIILAVIMFLLIGVLIATIFFKDQLAAFLSGIGINI